MEVRLRIQPEIDPRLLGRIAEHVDRIVRDEVPDENKHERSVVYISVTHPVQNRNNILSHLKYNIRLGEHLQPRPTQHYKELELPLNL